MKALVTGSNGFIGSLLVQELLKERFKVKCMVRKTSNLKWLGGLDVDYVYADLAKNDYLGDILPDVDVVFHLAGVTKAKNYQQYLQGNLQATKHLLQSCKTFAPKHLRFIFLSSQAAAGPSTSMDGKNETDTPEPISMYGKSKLLAENAVLKFGQYFQTGIIRPPSVYGPRDKDIYMYFKNIQNNVLLVLGDGKQRVSMIYVEDLIDGILLAFHEIKGNKVYFLCNDNSYDWITIGKTIAKYLGKNPKTIYVPYWLLDIISMVNISYSKVIGTPALLNRDKVLEMKQKYWVCRNDRAKKELNFVPKFDLERGIEKTVNWYRSQGWLG